MSLEPLLKIHTVVLPVIHNTVDMMEGIDNEVGFSKKSRFLDDGGGQTDQ